MTRTETAACSLFAVVAAGATIGLAAIRLSQMPARWVAAAMVGLALLLALAASAQPRRLLLWVFVLSLQLGLVLYLTQPTQSYSLGVSWPNALAIPLGSLTALVPLAMARARRFQWGGGMAWAVGLLLLTTAISMVDSPRRFIGLAHLLVWMAFFTIFLAAANAVAGAEDVRLVRKALLAALALQSLLYFVENLSGVTLLPTGETIAPWGESVARHGGTVGPRPATFASFLLPLLLMAVVEFLSVREPGAWRRYGALVAAGGAALALTFTRAAWIGFALGLCYVVAAGCRRRMLSGSRAAMLLVLLGVASLALLPGIRLRLSEDHLADVEERWELVRTAVRVIQANPWTGVGAGAYPAVFRDYLAPESADRWVYVVHNVYLLRAAEAGLPGLAAWLLVLGVAFRQASPDRFPEGEAQRLALGWRAGCIALWWEMLWDVTLGPAASSLMWFLCGLMVAAKKR